VLGAIIGDIVGSIYEWNRIKTKDFPFFTDDCFFTDDSVCTVAVADILLHGLPPAKTMQNWCRRYPGCSYGLRFGGWIYADPPEPYHSYGNGAAICRIECNQLGLMFRGTFTLSASPLRLMRLPVPTDRDGTSPG